MHAVIIFCTKLQVGNKAEVTVQGYFAVIEAVLQLLSCNRTFSRFWIKFHAHDL